MQKMTVNYVLHIMFVHNVTTPGAGVRLWGTVYQGGLTEEVTSKTIQMALVQRNARRNRYYPRSQQDTSG